MFGGNVFWQEVLIAWSEYNYEKIVKKPRQPNYLAEFKHKNRRNPNFMAKSNFKRPCVCTGSYLMSKNLNLQSKHKRNLA